MRPRRASFLILLPGILLANGCISTGLIKSALQGVPVRDEVGSVEKASQTPVGDLLFCATGALKDRHVSRPYTICVPGTLQNRQPTDCGYRGHLIELPRTVIKTGWPDAAMIERQQLTPLTVRSLSSGMIVGADLDEWRERLPVQDGERDTVYSVTGYATGCNWQLIHVAHDLESGKNELRAFTIAPAHIHPETYRIAYLPLTLLFDGCTIAGTLYGYPVLADAWTSYGERVGNARH